MNKKMSRKKKNVAAIHTNPITSDEDLFLRRRQVQRKVIVKILAEIDPLPEGILDFTIKKETNGLTSEKEHYEEPQQ